MFILMDRMRREKENTKIPFLNFKECPITTGLFPLLFIFHASYEDVI